MKSLSVLSKIVYSKTLRFLFDDSNKNLICCLQEATGEGSDEENLADSYRSAAFESHIS